MHVCLFRHRKAAPIKSWDSCVFSKKKENHKVIDEPPSKSTKEHLNSDNLASIASNETSTLGSHCIEMDSAILEWNKIRKLRMVCTKPKEN